MFFFHIDLIDGTSSNGTPALLGFIGGRCASVWTSVTLEERRKGLIECLARYFGGHKTCFSLGLWSLKVLTLLLEIDPHIGRYLFLFLDIVEVWDLLTHFTLGFHFFIPH